MIELRFKYTHNNWKTQVSNYWRRHNYEICINSLFHLDVPRRVIPVIDKVGAHQTVQPLHKNQQRLDWSCIPRTRPIINTDSSHELPDFKEIRGEFIDSLLNCYSYNCLSPIIDKSINGGGSTQTKT